MPILNADKARQVYVVKRGEGKGYAGIVNTLFYADNCNMVYGDAQAVLIKMIESVRGLGAEPVDVVGVALLVGAPWIIRRLAYYTIGLLSDFHRFVR